MSLETLNKEIIACRKCPRLVEWREEVARTKRKAYADWDYWGKPVPGFGDPKARVLVVGLAPGAHGSNRTGRQFTGDASGNFLFPALYRAGFASQHESISRDDDLKLKDMYITASGRCAPPKNKPTAEELDNCQPFLEREIELLHPKVIVVLGRIAFERILRIYSRTDHGLQTIDNDEIVHGPRSIVFSHGAIYQIRDGPWLVCSYHPSQQNTLTGKLTVEMFDTMWQTVRSLMEKE
jgi:uracil-DNA glycosylase family 4